MELGIALQRFIPYLSYRGQVCKLGKTLSFMKSVKTVVLLGSISVLCYF